MTLGISNRARAYIRSRATGNMNYTCQVQRIGAPSFDSVTGIYTAGEPSVLYTGVCRIWQVSGGGTVDVNQEGIILQQTKLSIPWNEGVGIKRDDEVKITAASYDPALVNKRYRILDVDKGGDLRATRTFTVQGIQEES